MNKKVNAAQVYLVTMLITLLLGWSSLFGKVGFQAGFGLVRNDGIDHGPHSGLFYIEFPTGFGYQFGLNYCLDIGTHNVLRVEALYALKGDTTNLMLWIRNYGLTKCTIYARYHYFEIPLLLEHYFSRSKQGFHLLGGIYAAYLLKARMSGLEEDNWSSLGDDYSAVKRYDFGWILGLGIYAKKNQHWRTSVQARIEMGMVDIARDDFYSYPDGGSSKNLALTLCLSFARGN